MFFFLLYKESHNHIFFDCGYAQHCWRLLFDLWNISWVFSDSLKENVSQLLRGSRWNSQAHLLLVNAVKAILSKLWMERNHRIFQNFSKSYCVLFDAARLKASSLWSLSKSFEGSSIQDIYRNWNAFIVPL